MIVNSKTMHILIKEAIKNNLLKEYEQSDIETGISSLDDMTPEERSAMKSKPGQSDIETGRSNIDSLAPEERKYHFKITHKGKEITFKSKPYEASAMVANKLFSGLGGESDTSKKGRQWIKDNIYAELDDRKNFVNYFAKVLGTKDESYWSSWTFGTCYKGDSTYRSMINSAEKRKPALAFYPAAVAKSNLLKIYSSPESFIGSTIYCLFKPTEAPAYKGDGLFFSRSGEQNSYKSIPTSQSNSKPSHMQVLIDNNGTAIGGNESQTIKKRQHKLVNQKAVNAKYGGSCLGVFKKIEVVSVKKLTS
jgi:hypothetical protein